MKRITFFLIFVFIFTAFSINAMSAHPYFDKTPTHGSRTKPHRDHKPVGAPLDGGLLLLLGGAGVAYYSTRKKKENS